MVVKTMNAEKKIEKLGITPIREFTQREVRYIAEEVTEMLVSTFPVLEDEYNNLLIRMLNCKMYVSSTNERQNLSSVNYIYDNSSIYFDEKVDFNNISNNILHECIHYLQDLRTEKGKLKKMGLCSFGELSSYRNWYKRSSSSIYCIKNRREYSYYNKKIWSYFEIN